MTYTVGFIREKERMDVCPDPTFLVLFWGEVRSTYSMVTFIQQQLLVLIINTEDLETRVEKSTNNFIVYYYCFC